jgi:hypothetical protein
VAALDGPVAPVDGPLDVPVVAVVVGGALEPCAGAFDDEHAATHSAPATQPDSSSPLVMSFFLRSRCVPDP